MSKTRSCHFCRPASCCCVAGNTSLCSSAISLSNVVFLDRLRAQNLFFASFSVSDPWFPLKCTRHVFQPVRIDLIVLYKVYLNEVSPTVEIMCQMPSLWTHFTHGHFLRVPFSVAYPQIRLKCTRDQSLLLRINKMSLMIF